MATELHHHLHKYHQHITPETHHLVAEQSVAVWFGYIKAWQVDHPEWYLPVKTEHQI